MKLSIGPLLYYWSRQAVLDFYESMANSPVDVIYLGETVCARRHELSPADWISLGKSLVQAGKEVILSTQVLLESGSHMQTMRQLTENPDWCVEANDMGAVHLLAGKAFVAGPHLNVYHPDTLALLAEEGACRWVAPLEMQQTDLAHMLSHCPSGMQTEVFVYGRMPLAFSARCFTARHYDLPKDDCQFRCLEYPDGLLLKTGDEAEFLVLNGIQTQSARVMNLVHELPQMRQMGVDVLRLSPQSRHMPEIIRIFKELCEEKVSAAAAFAALEAWMPAAACNGYWYGQAGMDWVTLSQ